MDGCSDVSDDNVATTSRRRSIKRKRRVLEDDSSDDTTSVSETELLVNTGKRKVVKRGGFTMMNHSSESEGGSCSSTEVAIRRGGGRRRSRLIDSDEEMEKCLPGLENAAPQKLPSDEESEDGGAVMSGPKTRLLRRTVHDGDFDSSSNKQNAKKLSISMFPASESPRMHNQKNKRLLKGDGVRSGDEGDSGSSLDEFIVDEEESEVEEELGCDEEDDEEGVSINYMALTFQLQQDEDRRFSGNSALLTFEKAFPQYLQYLCLAVDPRLDDRHPGKTNGEEFMSRWPFDMYKLGLNHLAAAKSKVESDIQYQLKAYLQSGAWSSSFVKSIQSYPIVEFKCVGRYFGDSTCSACNHERDGDLFLGVLGGPFYDSISVWNSKRWDRYLPNGWDINGDAIKCFQDETSETIMLGTYCHSKVALYHTLNHYKANLVIRTLQQLREPDGMLLVGQELTRKHKWVKKERKLLAKLLGRAKHKWEGEKNSEIWREKSIVNALGSDSEPSQQQDDSSSCEKGSTCAFQVE